MSNYHVYPEKDVLDHDTDSGDCACLPTIVPVERDDGSMAYLIVHNAWDERTE
jgi:hypothetical protein